MTAAEIVPRDQPKSACSGSIKTLGAARKLPAPTRATKAVTATSHGHSERLDGATVSAGAVSTVVLMTPPAVGRHEQGVGRVRFRSGRPRRHRLGRVLAGSRPRAWR